MTTESKSALNILRHIAASHNSPMYDLYDVLLAMSGHIGTILDPRAKVDSKLYGLIFDLIRFNDYERYDGRYVARKIEARKHRTSSPWLDPVEYPNFAAEFSDVIPQTRARNIGVCNAYLPNLPPAVTNCSAQKVPSAPPAVTDSSAPPPSYGSVILIPPTAPTAPYDTEDGLPSYESKCFRITISVPQIFF